MSCSAYPQSWGQPTIKFAEDNLCGWIAQPANTWSNLAYLVVVVVIAWEISRSKLKNPILWGFPVVTAIIGFSSGFYHASATFIGQFFDFASIYVLGTYLIYLSLSRRKIPQSYLLCGLFLLTAVLLLTLWSLPFLRIWLAFAMLFALLYSEFTSPVKPKSYSSLYYELGFLALAFLPWLLDEFLVWDYAPLEHWINGHALWHALNSFSLYFAYHHYGQPSLNSNPYESAD